MANEFENLVRELNKQRRATSFGRLIGFTLVGLVFVLFSAILILAIVGVVRAIG